MVQSSFIWEDINVNGLVKYLDIFGAALCYLQSCRFTSCTAAARTSSKLKSSFAKFKALALNFSDIQNIRCKSIKSLLRVANNRPNLFTVERTLHSARVDLSFHIFGISKMGIIGVRSSCAAMLMNSFCILSWTLSCSFALQVICWIQSEITCKRK